MCMISRARRWADLRVDICIYSFTKNIDNATSEIINECEYKIDEVIDCLKDKTWHGLFERLERHF